MRLLYNRFVILIVLALGAGACTDTVDEGSQPGEPNFTIAVNPNKFQELTFTNTTVGNGVSVWSFGDGSELSYEKNPVHLYAEPGTYTVTLNTRSQGGSLVKSVAIVVQGNEPPNLIAGGDMSDASKWTVMKTDMTQTTTEFANGALKFSNGAGPAQTNVLVWTTVQVDAGRPYKFSANVKGSGANNSWLEVLFGTVEPVANSDYSDGLYTGLNTWDGCAKNIFNGNLATLGCKANAAGTNKGGVVTFANSGTICLVFKGGSWDGTLGTDGITLDDVKLQEMDVENMIDGGDMSDATKWNVTKTDMTETTTEFADGALKFSNGTGPSQTNVLVWTSVEVEAGKNYRFAAKVKGSGASNSWLEVLFGTAEPVANSDYSTGLYTGLNTWDGCATSTFNGNLATLGCKANAAGTGKGGAVTFEESGTIYIVFKGGSWDGSLGTEGITLDDVQLFEVE